MTHGKKLNQKSQTHTEHTASWATTSSEHDLSFDGSIKRLSDDLYMHLLMPTKLFM